MSRPRYLHLNVNIHNSGRHPASWRLQKDASMFLELAPLLEIARLAEESAFDALFLGDSLSLPQEPPERPWNSLDPVAVLSALTAVTQHIGLVGTVSSTFGDPFHAARQWASIDHLSRGRAGVNIVTSYAPASAANFGTSPLPAPAERYQRAAEFVEVMGLLWDSWEDGAITGDRLTGRFLDPERVHRVDHHGRHFDVRGPALVPRSPQGRPVLVQAGSSEQGRDFGSATADIVYTAQTSVEAARSFYRDIKERARGHGRGADDVLVIPGLVVVVGSTEEEARARKAELDALFPFERELPRLAAQLGVAVDDLDLDSPVPTKRLPDLDLPAESRGSRGIREAIRDQARSRQQTVRELLLDNGGGHRMLVGTPDRIASDLESWLRAGAADGFTLHFDVLPDGLRLFADHVVPVLRRRGLVRPEYAAGETLRERLGLSRPRSHYESKVGLR